MVWCLPPLAIPMVGCWDGALVFLPAAHISSLHPSGLDTLASQALAGTDDRAVANVLES